LVADLHQSLHGLARRFERRGYGVYPRAHE
jgi:hypothetical protein